MASITKKPTGTVASTTSPARNANTQTFTSTWKVPNSHTSSDNEGRATGVEVQWQLELSNSKPWISRTGGTSWNSDTLRLNSDWVFNDGKAYNRQSFWPYSDQRLYRVHAWIRETNSKGKGAWVHVSRPIEYPRNPTMTAPVMSEEIGHAGEVSVDVTWDKDNSGYHDADRCQYWVMLTDPTTNYERTQTQYGTKGSTSFTLTYDAANRMSLAWDDYIKIEFQAKAQGWRGNSDLISKTFFISYPSIPTITNVDVSGTDNSSKVTAFVDLGNANPHPVTGCLLEMLVGTTAQTEAEATASNAWTSTGVTDNGTCQALAVTAETLLNGTAAGQSIWLRVKSWNHTDSIFYRYSAPVRVTDLETPAASAQTSTIHVLSVIPGDDGRSAVATLGWNDGGTAMTKTELTWSDDPNAWKSTDAPRVYEFDWSDGAITSGGTTYPDSAKIYIRGLDEGTKYYVKARRVLEAEVGTTYSNYSPEAGTVFPVTAPSSVTLTLPQYVKRGDSFAVSWTYDSEATQKSWQLAYGKNTKTVSQSTITETWTEYGLIAAGSDTLGGYVIPWERFESILGNDTEMSFVVRVSVGGDFVQSAAKTVQVADAPVISTDWIQDGILTAQPLSFDVASDKVGLLSVVVTAQGAQGSSPDGLRTQVAGDTVYSAVIDPVWASGETTVTLPTGLDLWDGARYTVDIVEIDGGTGLRSEHLVEEFAVEWSHQAPAPPSTITVTPTDVTDSDGFRSLNASIQLAAPTGSVSTDRYDIYRVTPDGAVLVGEDAKMTDLVVDRYAPFGTGSHLYRVALRTADGDVEWTDYPYTLAASDLRIDFGSQYVELPWNITVGDAYTKDFEARAHIGDPTPQGYWNDSVKRAASFSTKLIRVSERSTVDALRSLARYSGPCFVRTPNGSAYQADVSVSGLDESYNGGLVAVALDGTEVALTDYMADVPIPEHPEGDD